MSRAGRLRSDWTRYRALPVPERRALRGAAWALLWIGPGMRLLGYRRLRAWLGRRPPVAGGGGEPAGAARLAEHVAAAASRMPYRVTCLPRALTLWWLLRRRGFDPELRLGVRRQEEEGMEAHAWVTLDGTVLGDRPDVEERYRPLEPVAGDLRG